MTSILIADDHAIFRLGLKSLLEAEPDLTVCAQATSASEALDALTSPATPPALAILDLSLGSDHGMVLIRQFKAHSPDLPILILTFRTEASYVARALGAGASSYLLKAERSTDIIAAVRATIAGQRHLASEFTALPAVQCILHYFAEGRTPYDKLTDREGEVFTAMGEGLNAEQICTRLAISPKTLETHRSHIKSKFPCQTAEQITRFALDWHLFWLEASASESISGRVVSPLTTLE